MSHEANNRYSWNGDENRLCNRGKSAPRLEFQVFRPTNNELLIRQFVMNLRRLAAQKMEQIAGKQRLLINWLNRVSGGGQFHRAS